MVFAILKSRKLNLKGNTAPLIEVESGSNDPMAHMLTLAMISVLNGNGEGFSLVWHVLLEIVLGIGLGLLIAKAAAVALKHLEFRTEGLNTLFIFAIAILSFAVPAVNQANPHNDIFNLVFMLVLLSMAVQGSFLPWISKKLDMIDRNSNVLRTFNDFVDEETNFGKVEINAGSNWIGKSISQLDFPEGLTVALVIRDTQFLTPRSDFVLEEGDTVVTLSKTFHGIGAKVKEKTVKVDSRRIGKPIEANPGKSIIIMIKRDDECIIPNGQTILQSGDQLVILDLED